MATPFPFTLGQTLTAAQMNAITTLPSTTKTVSHTLVIADQGTRVIMNSASATSVTVDTSIFGAGDIVEIQNIGVGVCTVTAGTATVSSAGPLAIPQFGGGQLFFTSAGVSIFFPTAVTQSASKFSQIVQATTATAVTTTSTSYVTTGLSASITPTTNTSKILVMVTLPVANANVNGANILTIFRGTVSGTNLFTATGFAKIYGAGGGILTVAASNFLDSPATTSATTYTVGFKTEDATSTATAQVASTTSTITLIEVLA